MIDKIKRLIKKIFHRGANAAPYNKEYKIGEAFTFQGIEFIVKEDLSHNCLFCYYDDEIYGCMRPYKLKLECNGKKRTDKKDVIFKLKE